MSQNKIVTACILCGETPAPGDGRRLSFDRPVKIDYRYCKTHSPAEAEALAVQQIEALLAVPLPRKMVR